MGSSSKLVLLCGYYGYGNGGDEALLATLLQMLPESVTPVVMTATPAETAEQHQVETCDRNSPLSVLKLMTRAEGFIWGGGSLIQDSTSWLSPLYYILWMSIAQLLRLKTVAWAQGIGPLRRPVIRAIASWSFGHCTARSTRDTGSSKLLDQWRLDYRIAPDPVWAMAGHVPPSLGPTSGSGTELNVKTVAVVLRAHPLLTKDRLNTLIQAFIQFQAETQAHLLLLPFQRSQDYDIARTIEARLSGNRSLLMCDNPRQLKGVFATVDMAIAMRLHALIMAAAEGCRGFALSYDPKVTRLMEEISLPGYELATLPLDSGQIATAWQAALAAPPTCDADVIQDQIRRSLEHQTLLRQIFTASV